LVDEKDRETAIETGALYADIWDQFDARQWEEFSDNHFDKWSKLPLPDAFFQGKLCLDAGCGSGRFTRSLLLKGVERVFAVDMGEGCVRNTRTRNADFADRLDVQQASVLELPFENDTFDFVHCDGVLHHTTDPYQGFSELTRVLKPGGYLVTAVYGRGGGMNFAIYAARLFRRLIPYALTFKLCKMFSSNPVTLYAVMDCMYVPIRKNYYAEDILAWHSRQNLEDVVRLDSSWGPYAYGRWMRGEGYLKFMARKKAEPFG
jgi:SAM-dependent methyltransferase